MASDATKRARLLYRPWALAALLSVLLLVFLQAESNSQAKGDTWSPQQEALRLAVEQKDLEKVSSLLASGVEAPPLILLRAAGRSPASIIQALIGSGVDVNAPVDLGGGVLATPLGSAVLERRPAIVSLLCRAGAKVDAPHMNTTPMDWARQRHFDDVVKALRSCGAAGLADLESAVDAIERGDQRRLRELLRNGVSPNARGKDGRPLIHVAAQQENSAALKLLLQSGANPDQRDDRGGHAVERAPGKDSVQIPLLRASTELNRYRRAPRSKEDEEYPPGAVIGGPCQHTGAIPKDAGCGSSGTEIVVGTHVSTSGWSASVGPPLCKPVTLPPLPGVYKVSTIESKTRWTGNKCYEQIGQVYFNKTSSSRTSTHRIKVSRAPSALAETPDEKRLEIHRDGQNITGKRVEVYAGERLELEAIPLGGELKSPSWSLPGDYVEDYRASEQKAEVDPLEGEELRKARIAYAWWSGGSFKVRVSASVDGAAKSATATFVVKQPETRMKATVHPKGRGGLVMLNGRPELTFLGETTSKKGGNTIIETWGIEFDRDELEGEFRGDELQWVQIVKTNILYRQQTYFEGSYAPYPVSLACKGLEEPSYFLDKTYPYESTKQAYDFPYFERTKAFGQFIDVWVDEHLDLKMFLMYRHDSPDAIWVPLRQVYWTFDAGLCWGRGAASPRSAKATIKVPRSPFAAKEFPVWTRKVREHPDDPKACKPQVHRCDRYAPAGRTPRRPGRR